jgi:hypothetical protein
MKTFRTVVFWIHRAVGAAAGVANLGFLFLVISGPHKVIPS